MAVDGPHIVESKFIEQRPGHHHALHVLFGPFGKRLGARQTPQHPFAAFSNAQIKLAAQDASEVTRQSPHIFRNRHRVIIEDHEQIRVRRARMIERFKSKTRGHCPIANHRYRAGRVSLRLFGDGHPERCANGCRRVADAKRVVRAFFSHREGGDSPCLSQRVHPFTTAR